MRQGYQASLFVTRYPPDVEISEVKDYLENSLKELTGENHSVKIEKLETRYASYSSFKVTCICPDTNIFMDPCIWPDGVLVKWWRAPRYDSSITGTGSYYS